VSDKTTIKNDDKKEEDSISIQRMKELVS